MSFDADAVGRLLRSNGLDLDPEAFPVELGRGRYAVRVTTRMLRDPAGERVVELTSTGKWRLVKGSEK